MTYFKENFKILEIGPDNIPSSYCRRISDFESWDTLEVDSQRNDKITFITSELYNYPISDSTYDIVLACQVMEHVPDLRQWLKELKRIVKYGGFIFLITPTSWPYHEAPIDCWRIYPEGMKCLAKDNDLVVDLIVNESLEIESLKELKNLKFIEGRSCFHDTTIQGIKKINFYNGIIKNIPIIKNLQVSTEVAFDMLTILQKPK